jgi:transposase InsO family protein
VGRRVAETLRAELALDALEMALWTPKGKLSKALVHHGDRGNIPRSATPNDSLTRGIARSVGRKGDSYDNVLAESINALYKK